MITCCRSLRLAVWSILLCFAIAMPAAAEFAKATKIGAANALDNIGCDGGFPDITGKCWKCPKGYKHDNILLTPDDPKVCKDEGGRDNRKGTSHGAGTGLLKTDCPRGQWISTHNNVCYSCPDGYSHDIFKKGNQDGVCYKDRKDRYDRANPQKGTLVCKSGGFFDMIDGGSCWTCPKGMIRTAAGVKNERACTNKVTEFFSVTPVETCKVMIASIKKGEKGLQDLMKQMDALIEPIKKPLDDEVDKLTRQLRTPEEVKKLFADISKKVDTRVLDRMYQLQTQLRSAGGKLDDVLLDSKLMCQGTPRQIEQRLADLGFRPNLGPKTVSLDDWLIPSAHAATAVNSKRGIGSLGSGKPSVFLAAGVSGVAVHPQYHIGWNIGFSVVTNFEGDGGIYFSTGPAVSTAVAGVGFGVMIFPHNTLNDFALAPWPGVGISVGAGDKVKDFFNNIKKGVPVANYLPDSIELSIDPSFQSWPGIGLSKGVGSSKMKYVDITGATAWSFPILQWDKNGVHR